MTIEQLRALPAKKKSKYGNRKVVYDSKTFDSQKECDRFKDLVLMEKAGEIRKLCLQVEYPIWLNGRKVCVYVADFVYKDRDDKTVVEDTKGMRTAIYRLKKKMVEAFYGITILET